MISCAPRSRRPRNSSSVAILNPTNAPTATVAAKARAVRTLFFILISLVKLNHLAKNARQLFLILKLDLDFILAARALDANVRVKHLTQNACSLLKRLRRCRARCFRRLSGRKQWGKIFCRTDRQSLCNNLLSKIYARIFIRNRKNCTRMTSSQLAFEDHLLNYLWKIKQAQRIGDCGTRLADSL